MWKKKKLLKFASYMLGQLGDKIRGYLKRESVVSKSVQLKKKKKNRPHGSLHQTWLELLFKPTIYWKKKKSYIALFKCSLLDSVVLDLREINWNYQHHNTLFGSKKISFPVSLLVFNFILNILFFFLLFWFLYIIILDGSN